MPTFTVHSICSGLFRILSNTVEIILGIIPLRTESSISGPYIVNVFPEEVYPYAKIVPLNPYSTLSTIGSPAN